jgi:hypothetical protein
LFEENNQTLPISTRQGRILVIFLAHGKRVLAETKQGKSNDLLTSLRSSWIHYTEELGSKCRAGKVAIEKSSKQCTG